MFDGRGISGRATQGSPLQVYDGYASGDQTGRIDTARRTPYRFQRVR